MTNSKRKDSSLHKRYIYSEPAPVIPVCVSCLRDRTWGSGSFPGRRVCCKSRDGRPNGVTDHGPEPPSVRPHVRSQNSSSPNRHSGGDSRDQTPLNGETSALDSLSWGRSSVGVSGRRPDPTSSPSVPSPDVQKPKRGLET